MFWKRKQKIRDYTTQETQRILENHAASIPQSEKQYYDRDSYYQPKIAGGTMFERNVITFEERKLTAIPSNRGLYVPEILMLHFCKKYPNPKNGYPGYWWYKYGIRDVGSVFNSLVERGFLILNDSTGKYETTELGKAELKENEYIPYMHKNSKDITFTVWDLNKLLGTGDKSKYVEIIEKRHNEINTENKNPNNEFMKELKGISPKSHDILCKQDEQIKAVQAAEKRYSVDKDIEWIINFWEEIWDNGGLCFNSSKWAFRLPDLYIQTHRYNDALIILQKIKQTHKQYSEKADGYIEKIKNK